MKDAVGKAYGDILGKMMAAAGDHNKAVRTTTSRRRRIARRPRRTSGAPDAGIIGRPRLKPTVAQIPPMTIPGRMKSAECRRNASTRAPATLSNPNKPHAVPTRLENTSDHFTAVFLRINDVRVNLRRLTLAGASEAGRAIAAGTMGTAVRAASHSCAMSVVAPVHLRCGSFRIDPATSGSGRSAATASPATVRERERRL
jgi:hypothetical protein